MESKVTALAEFVPGEGLDLHGGCLLAESSQIKGVRELWGLLPLGDNPVDWGLLLHESLLSSKPLSNSATSVRGFNR